MYYDHIPTSFLDPLQHIHTQLRVFYFSYLCIQFGLHAHDCGAIYLWAIYQ